MNQAIAHIIKGHIESLDFVDKIAGLVAPLTFDITTKDESNNPKTVQKTVPVACCVTADDCKEGAYNELMPDSSYKTVIYFEDGGISFDRYEGNRKYYRSNLRLVCWINIEKITESSCKSEAPCTYAAHIITEIIRALPLFPDNHTPFHRIYSEVKGQEVRNPSIFGAYTYDEKHAQYLMAPYDYFALTIETDFAICMDSNVVPVACDSAISQMIPVALTAENILCDRFTAKWGEETEATGYKLDIATDSSFTSLIYDDLDVLDVQEYNVTGLTTGTTYYYRVRAYDDNDESTSSNTVTAITLFCDWFLPSLDELDSMYQELKVYSLGSFSDGEYWFSSEVNNLKALSVLFATGAGLGYNKTELKYVRACRSFVAAAGIYSLRDTGPAGGLIFYISGTTYYEAAPTDQSISKTWSNIVNIAIGTTSIDIGEGINNTDEIIAQVGHTDSAAKLCDDLVV